MDDAVVVALFRHGITEENKRKAYIGWTDAPICEDARLVLANQTSKLSPYERVVTSDLKRCLQTAEVLFPDQDPQAWPEFREMNFGRWEGKMYEELAGDPYYEEWIKNHFASEPPEGEGYSTFAERIEKGWQKVFLMMLEGDLGRTAIVTHGGVIRYLLSKLGHEERGFWEWQVPHGNGFELVWSTEEAFRRGERCTLLRVVPLTENQVG
ncbi:histidine phosphatase family protein [Bacillus sp. V3B]|uniref:histidine phosphatase family protein n=1 Tax=Bacillus sp. V3B TaxID=2804915 RepID=UPI00210A9E86|nr:histidine phosphatase family protein [Bacillus sp. V3B]MCQ6276943.1 histidine phosphatase family protein [Bacillus sp. V3B]